MNITLFPYDSKWESTWNNIVDHADNSHFMINRNYMDYHADRFQDASFLIREENKIIGIIPGNRSQTLWHSHQGLTFGGVLFMPEYNRIKNYAIAYKNLFILLKEQNITSAHIKPIPHIYHRNPCESELYVLQNHFEKLYVEASTAVNLQTPPSPSTNRIRNYKKSQQKGVSLKENDNFSAFWNILTTRLKEKFNKSPVHSLDEIELLRNRFPNNITLYTAMTQNRDTCAGTVIYETETTAHAQYIASNQVGLEYGALDYVFFKLLEKYREKGKKFFDFGISTENKGEILNDSLALFKESFGGGTILHYQLKATL